MKLLEEDADPGEHHGEGLPPGEGIEDVRPLPGHPQGLLADALGREGVGRAFANSGRACSPLICTHADQGVICTQIRG